MEKAFIFFCDICRGARLSLLICLHQHIKRNQAISEELLPAGRQRSLFCAKAFRDYEVQSLLAERLKNEYSIVFSLLKCLGTFCYEHTHLLPELHKRNSVCAFYKIAYLLVCLQLRVFQRNFCHLISWQLWFDKRMVTGTQFPVLNSGYCDFNWDSARDGLCREQKVHERHVCVTSTETTFLK